MPKYKKRRLIVKLHQSGQELMHLLPVVSHGVCRRMLSKRIQRLPIFLNLLCFKMPLFLCCHPSIMFTMNCFAILILLCILQNGADEITWQTYNGQLTERQEKTRSKIMKRMEKVNSHVRTPVLMVELNCWFDSCFCRYHSLWSASVYGPFISVVSFNSMPQLTSYGQTFFRNLDWCGTKKKNYIKMGKWLFFSLYIESEAIVLVLTYCLKSRNWTI